VFKTLIKLLKIMDKNPIEEKDPAMPKAAEDFRSRQQRRAEERAKEKELPRTLAETERGAKASEEFLRTMLKRFQDDYNQFLQTASGLPIEKVEYDMTVGINWVNEEEIKFANENALNAAPKQLVRDEKDPKRVSIMYLRIEKNTVFKDELPPPVARPGAVEQVMGHTLNQLVYHSAVLLHYEKEAITAKLRDVGAQHKIINDCIEHFMISGVQFQEEQNEKTWKKTNQLNKEQLQQKVNEVNEIFSHAAEMKVNN
jgi:hypothetical protein